MSYEQWPYLGVFFVLLACGLGLPLPEDVPLLTGGLLVHEGLARLPIMIAVAMAGVLAGDCVLFGLGRKWGHRVVEHRFFRRVVNPPRLVTAERLFQRHGIKIIFVGRFLPGLRPMIFMAAGVLRVPFSTFLLVNGFAACISVPLLVFLGKLFGHNIDRIRADVRAVTHVILFAVLIAAMVAAAVYLHRRQKRLMSTAGVEPDIDADKLVQMPPQAEPLDMPAGKTESPATRSPSRSAEARPAPE
jgi:membrane protein DedA with SNARE-associated domain